MQSRKMTNRILESVILKKAEKDGLVKIWWKNIKGVECPHRVDGGPAIMWTDGSNSWRVFGEEVYSYKKLQKLLNLSSKEMVFLKLKYGNIS